MNLITLYDDDFTSDQRVSIRDRRLKHVLEVHRPEIGQSLKVGKLNGLIGTGIVESLDQQQLILGIELNKQPPPTLPLTVILALPRPKMLKRILQSMATLGVEELILINSYRVEKSFWQTPILKPEAIEDQLILGLEQAGATQLPKIRLEKLFKPFVEDRLPDLTRGKRALVAHPYQAENCPAAADEPTLIAIGPEGGFITYEIEKLIEAGLSPIQLGPRILKVETAIPVLTAKLFR